MKISELIKELELLKEIHGDLGVVTPGFDECDYDWIDKPTIMHILPDTNKECLYYGRHSKSECDQQGCQKVAFINW